MKVLKPSISLFVVLVAVMGAAVVNGEPLDSNLFTVKTYYPSDVPFNYQALYLSYRLRFMPVRNITCSISLLKGSGERGYYPPGYTGRSDGGVYEQGSFYLLLEDYLRINKITLGNYTPLFGQGLLFGGAFPLLLYNPYYDLARYRDGIYPTASTSKTVLLEGIALEYELNTLKIRPFLSWNSYDCTAGESTYYKYNDNDWDGIKNEDDEDDFSGFIEGFGHEYSCKNHIFSCIREEPDYGDESDRLKRNNLDEYVAGLNFSTNLEDVRVGATLYYSQFNRLVDPYYNFDPQEGDKTAYYFRGKNYYAGSIYFKLDRPFEAFGEMASTLYNRRSYYPEFNGEIISSLAFSGGFRTKFRGVGVILWGAYVPPAMVNPHGLELPDGLNNVACGLLGINRAKGKRRFVHWVYAFRELASIDYPAYLETGVSYNHRIDYPLSEKLTFKSKQFVELVDHHAYAPESLALRLSSKTSLSRRLSDTVDAQFSFESRLGGPLDGKIKSGVGVSGEIIHRAERSSASLMLMGYTTADDRFAYLYPYERSLESWSFTPTALHGSGFSGSAVYVRHFKRGMSAGAKIKYQIDLEERYRRGYTIYIMGEFPF